MKKNSMKISVVSILALTLTSCAAIPVYEPPTDLAQSAHLRLALKDQSLLAGVATIRHIDGDIICDQPLPNQKKMIVISKGNPLISDLNPSGTYIPAAGKKFTFMAMGLNDGFRECGRVVSFVPKAGNRYEITLVNAAMRGSNSQALACPVEIVDVSRKENPVSVDVTYETCRPK
jgi:hypothetical protein